MFTGDWWDEILLKCCQEPGKTAYMGCIGDDEFGKKLTDACKKVG